MELQRNPFGLRMPKEIQDWVKGIAETQDRSQNYIINQILADAKKSVDDAFDGEAENANT